MKKAILISDSHNQNEGMFAVIEHFSDCDAIFHMGDIGNARPLLESRARCLTYVVKGNTDYDVSLPEYVAIDFAGLRVVATHGHRYTDYGISDALMYFGQENHADVLLFGHIHRPELVRVRLSSAWSESSQGSLPVRDTAREMIICNPGSISRPRQSDRKCTFAILTVEDGHATITHYASKVDLHGRLTVETYEFPGKE